MIVTFKLDYFTTGSERLCLRLLRPFDDEIEMHCHGASAWECRVTCDDAAELSYSYLVKDGDKVVRSEWGAPHTLVSGKTASEYFVVDYWQDIPLDKPFYSQAFTACINRREGRARVLTLRGGYLTLEVEAPRVVPDCSLLVCGNCPQLGDWDPAAAPAMNDAAFPVWTLNIPMSELPCHLEFKFLKVDRLSRKVLRWESGANRVLDLPGYDSRRSVRCSGLRFDDDAARWRGAGVAIPVFSLRSEADFGVGDFYDLKQMVDWAAATGQRFIQILPVNDTTMTGRWTDSYPYNANSTFALHPMYLRLEALGTLRDKSRRNYFEAKRRELNGLKDLDYEAVNAVKLDYAAALFRQNGVKTLASDDFSAFLLKNEAWLKPYAAFCVLRDKFKTPDYTRWGEYAVYDAARVDAFVEANKESISFVYYLQYHLDKQLHQVRAYAHSRGVAIKGDIPIGISRTSVDAWLSPRLFNLDCQAGAPPDEFSDLGQNWGFPTYNWVEMRRDGYAWWKARFRKMAEYFDAYRIDHVLGFFRIWQIPLNAVHGLLGVFSPALPLSEEEMLDKFAFRMDRSLFTSPLIMDWILSDLFGALSSVVKERYLDSIADGRYALKPFVNTQRKIVDYFAGLNHTDENAMISQLLMRLIDDVLFIEDPYQKGKYHPRISAYRTYQYRVLTDSQREAFDLLYNDFYYHRHDEFWYHMAMEKLPPLIEATSMLTCAEDLGMIPHCVPAVMDELKILTLDIQRMPKEPDTRFGNPARYPYYSVCTTSTHDMGGIRQWWEENRQNTEAFFRDMLKLDGRAPHFAEPWVCEKIVTQNLLSPAMLCILPLQDWLSIDGTLRRQNPMDEQINEPSNPRHYWRYRMHLTLEQLLEETSFNDRIRELIAAAGR